MLVWTILLRDAFLLITLDVAPGCSQVDMLPAGCCMSTLTSTTATVWRKHSIPLNAL